MAIMQVVEDKQKHTGNTFIVADGFGVREGDLVFWISGAEATRAFPNRKIPSDVSIVGLVDSLDM